MKIVYIEGANWQLFKIPEQGRESLIWVAKLEAVKEISMDENEFRRVLELFPVVRSRDYHADLDFSRQSSRSGPSEDKNEAFWGKLKSAAERKVGPAEAERFCKAFQQVYKKLVYEELTSDAARRIMNSRNSGWRERVDAHHAKLN